MTTPRPTPPPNLIVESLGGWRGMVDASLPTLVFIVVNIAASLRVALVAAVAAGIVVLVERLVRRGSPLQAVGGFFGLGVAVLIAAVSGEARNFFLPGLLFNLAYAAVFTGSVVVGRPFVGVLAAVVRGRDQSWRADPVQRRVYTQLTLVWAGVFAARLAVQLPLYLADRTGWLGAAKLAMGTPLFLALLFLTVVTVRRLEEPAAADVGAGEEVSASR